MGTDKLNQGTTARSFFLGFIALFLAVPQTISLDPHEVTNRQYLPFVRATGHPPPENWTRGQYPEGTADQPVVLVTWHDAVAYCKWAGKKRLPTVEEWMGACQAGNLVKRGDVWEWTSTDVQADSGTFKALCGPKDECDCSHRYLPEWKNEVKGFRCTAGSPYLTFLR